MAEPKVTLSIEVTDGSTGHLIQVRNHQDGSVFVPPGYRITIHTPAGSRVDFCKTLLPKPKQTRRRTKGVPRG